MKARIIGLGAYLPQKILSNADLESMVDTSDEWIFSRTGMRERRIASEEETPSFMGAEAALSALEQAELTAKDIDFIICTTCTPDTLMANTGARIQTAIGADTVGAMDVQAACSGMLYGLSLAKAYVESGMYKRVLVVSPEKLSSMTDYTDRTTCILFGDGASAAVVTGKGGGFRLDAITLGSDGDQSDLLTIPEGGARKPFSEETLTSKGHFIKMEGREVFKHAVRRMEYAAKECLDHAGLSESDIAWLVPHQANTRIIEAVAKRFSLSDEQIFLTIHKYGNTSASSLGIALHELDKEHPIKEHEHLLLVVFGAGFTWGAAVLTKVNE